MPTKVSAASQAGHRSFPNDHDHR